MAADDGYWWHDGYWYPSRNPAGAGWSGLSLDSWPAERKDEFLRLLDEAPAGGDDNSDVGVFGRVTDEQLVYFAEKESYVKIGISNNVAQRVYGQLSADLLFTEPGGYIREQRLHTKFARCKVDPPDGFRGRTEWFLPDRTMQGYIDARRTAFPELMAA